MNVICTARIYRLKEKLRVNRDDVQTPTGKASFVSVGFDEGAPALYLGREAGGPKFFLTNGRGDYQYNHVVGAHLLDFDEVKVLGFIDSHAVVADVQGRMTKVLLKRLVVGLD